MWPEELGRDPASLHVGEAATRSWVVDEEDVRAFARLTGDANPLHLNREFGRRTIFGDMNAHGMFVASLIVGVVGSLLPGAGWFCHSIDRLQFLRPVYIGDELSLTLTVSQVVKSTRMVVLDGVAKNQAGERVVVALVRAQVALPAQG